MSEYVVSRLIPIQVREMTVDEVAEIVRDNRKRAWPPEDCNDIAKALAKLGTIRIVEKKQ